MATLATQVAPAEPRAHLEAPPSYGDTNRDIIATLRPPGRKYYIGMACVLAGLAFGAFCWGYQLRYGLGVTGYQPPIFWGTYITTFVFWVGIAHSGTLISAILYLFRSGWRTAVYRTAEMMTTDAIATFFFSPMLS